MIFIHKPDRAKVQKLTALGPDGFCLALSRNYSKHRAYLSIQPELIFRIQSYF